METSEARGPDARELLALRREGIARLAHLWDRVERIGFVELSEKTGIAEARLEELLLAAAGGEPKAPSLWRRLGSIAFPVALLVGAIVGLSNIAAPQVVVRPATGLPALHLLAREDVEVRRALRTSKTFPSPREVLGRILLERVAGGEPLRESELGPPPGSCIGGRRVLSVPVGAAALGTVYRGASVALLLTPNRSALAVPQAGAVLPNVLILAVRRDAPSSLLVAVPEKDLATLGRYLGSSEVFPVQ